MQDDTIPTWEMPPGAKPEAPSPTDAERAKAFESTLEDVKFAGSEGETSEDNEGITSASSIVNYGANTACHELGVQGVADRIENFDPSGQDDPIGAFYETLGINNQEELDATKERETENLDPKISAQKISREHFVQAISDFKELVAEVKSDPRFNELNNAASSFGTTVFEIASQKAAESGGEPDFVGALMILRAQKRAMEAAEEAGLDKEEAAEAVLGVKSEEEIDEENPLPDPESLELEKAKGELAEMVDKANNFIQNYEDRLSSEEIVDITDSMDEAKTVLKNPLAKKEDFVMTVDKIKEVLKPVTENLDVDINQLEGDADRVLNSLGSIQE